MDFEDIQRLQRLGPRSLEHLPPYARNAAISAIVKVKELEESRLLREGLYYIVLIDLSGATIASTRLGKDANTERIQTFVQLTIHALDDTPLVNSALFIKDIGDAALFLFSAFTDVLAWHRILVNAIAHTNEQFEGQEEPAFWWIRAKTVVHLGEVSFSDDRDPVAMAVNQVFKIEKAFGADELGCTDHVRIAVSPILVEQCIIPVPCGEQVLPGETLPTRLWRLDDVSAT
jgi:class 3 adenylate cyclase